MQCKKTKRLKVELYATNMSLYTTGNTSKKNDSHEQTLPGTKGCQKPLEQDKSKVPLQHFHRPSNIKKTINNTINFS